MIYTPTVNQTWMHYKKTHLALFAGRMKVGECVCNASLANHAGRWLAAPCVWEEAHGSLSSPGYMGRDCDGKIPFHYGLMNFELFC